MTCFFSLEQRFDVLKETDREVQLLSKLLHGDGRRWWWRRVDFRLHRSPHDGLRIQPVAHPEIACLRLLDKPVQKTERAVVQFRLVRVFLRRLIPRLRARLLEGLNAEGRKSLDVLSHEQHGNEIRSGSCAAYDAFRKLLAEHLDALGQGPAIRRPKRLERMQGCSWVFTRPGGEIIPVHKMEKIARTYPPYGISPSFGRLEDEFSCLGVFSPNPELVIYLFFVVSPGAEVLFRAEDEVVPRIDISITPRALQEWLVVLLLVLEGELAQRLRCPRKCP